MYAVKINADGTTETLDYPTGNDADVLRFLQSGVGGWIEHVNVTIHGREFSMWVNEEGLLQRLPYNGAASYLYATSWDTDGLIVGNAIITKGNSRGDTLPLLAADVNDVLAGVRDYENAYNLDGM